MGFFDDEAADAGAFGDAAVVTIVGERVGGCAIGDAEEAVFAVPGVGDAVLEGEVAVGVVHGGAEAADGGVLVDIVGGVSGGGSAVDGEGGGGAVAHGIVVVGIADSSVVGGTGDLIGVVVAVGAGGCGAITEGFCAAASGGVDGVAVPADGGARFFVDAAEELSGGIVAQILGDAVFVCELIQPACFVVGVGGEGWRAVTRDVIELAFRSPGVIDG